MRVAVIDDHPLVRKGISAILEFEPDMEFAGEARDIEEAVKVIQEGRPDVVLVDLRLAEESGLDIIKLAKKRGYPCKFIILTSSTAEEDFYKAYALGIDGYALKEALPEELLYAIRLVNRGRKYYDPEILGLKMRNDNELNEKLTSREREVLSLLGKGLSNRDIANKLFITENTVKKHVSQVLAKLNLADRTQAALYANSKGLVENKLD